VPVRLVVVADSCTDSTVTLASALGAEVVEVRVASVGAVRATGMRHLLRAPVDPAAIWLATTDADSVVPRDWLSGQLECAAAGWDAVVGTVRVGDWSGHPPQLPALYARRYADWTGTHPHVHGANLGVRGDAYLAVGGFPALPVDEDHELVRALVVAGRRVLRTTDLPVLTSSRRQPRAVGGFGYHLRDLAAEAT
jgi:hypothetical protein